MRISDWSSDVCSSDLAPDYISDDLVTLTGLPITAAVLADGRKPPSRLEELSSHRLLRPRNAPDLWPRWLAGVGKSVGPLQFVEVENTHFAYEGAASGLGVAIERTRGGSGKRVSVRVVFGGRRII